MKKIRILLTIGALVVAAAVLPLSGASASASTVHAAVWTSPKLDRQVADALAKSGRADFLVVLKDQANLAPAAGLKTKLQKGEFVFNAVRSIANSTQPGVRAALDRLGLKYTSYYVVNLIAVFGGDTAAVNQIAALPQVARIESNAPVRMDLPKPGPGDFFPQAPATIEWNVSKINAPQVWALGDKGQGIVYANQDTGVSWTHPALMRQYRGWPNTAAPNNNYNWWDAVHADISGNGTNPCGFSSPMPCDDNGHGTHTMGTGIGDDGMGNQIGVAPAAKWIACHNMDEGVGRPSTYIECFQFFLAPWNLKMQNPDPSKAPDVMSNSWGCPPSETCTPDSLLAAVQADRAAGIFIAVSAGNSGPGCSSVSDPPAIYDESTTVGATDINDGLANFSSRGPVTVDGSNRLKPDISAPGVGVRSSYYNVNTHTNTYATLSGTSMASPHIAASVALVWNHDPALIGNVSATESVLFSTANINVSASGSCGGTPSSVIPNNLFGYGRVDVLAAVQSVP